MLERSLPAKFAKSVFYEKFNDFDVYVEDTSVEAKKLYSILLSRALGNKCNIDSVFPLGNKIEVLKACSDDNEAGGRPRIYIIDGDFCCIDSNPPNRNRLYVLKRYCIENYLIDEAAILDFLFEEDPVKEVSEIAAIFDFQGWLTRNGHQLCSLFLVFSIAHEHCPHIPTVSRPLRNFIGSSMGDFDESKVSSCISELRQAVNESCGLGFFDESVSSLESKHNKYSPQVLIRIVSGKDYLFPALMMRARQIVKIRADNTVIKLRLARRVDVSELAELRTLLEL